MAYADTPQARWNRANPDKVKAYAAKYRAERPELARSRNARGRAANTAKLAALKSGPCVDCLTCYPPCAMDFDHVTGERKYSINASVMGRKDLAEELAKCELRCANCHRIRHHNPQES